MTLIQQRSIVMVVELKETRKEACSLANIELLKCKIHESGMTMTAIAEKSGVLRETIYNRMNGKGDFTASEIVRLSKTLRLTKPERDKIFLSH